MEREEYALLYHDVTYKNLAIIEYIRKITSRVASVAPGPRLSRKPHSHKQCGYIIPVVATQVPQSLVVPQIYHNLVMGPQIQIPNYCTTILT
jgi:hypothetical protein